MVESTTLRSPRALRQLGTSTLEQLSIVVEVAVVSLECCDRGSAFPTTFTAFSLGYSFPFPVPAFPSSHIRAPIMWKSENVTRALVHAVTAEKQRPYVVVGMDGRFVTTPLLFLPRR